jgi:hypothetical protein
MMPPYMFLSLIIPGPDCPKGKIDVYLQPLIDELQQLWTHGVVTYDASKRQNFRLRASLMRTINDFPAYGMLSGWSTAGTFACPVCMEKTESFRLDNGRKQSWFDSHRKFLPYDHPFRRNKVNFYKNTIDMNEPPRRLNGEDQEENEDFTLPMMGDDENDGEEVNEDNSSYHIEDDHDFAEDVDEDNSSYHIDN